MDERTIHNNSLTGLFDVFQQELIDIGCLVFVPMVGLIKMKPKTRQKLVKKIHR